MARRGLIVLTFGVTLLTGSLLPAASSGIGDRIPLTGGLDPGVEAARVAPGMPLNIVLANDVAYRRSLGFRADAAYVRALYAHPSFTTNTREHGALFTPAEAAEERLRREDLPADADAAERALRAAGLADAIGAIFIDHERGGIVVVRVTRSEQLAASIARGAVRHPDRLVVEQSWVTEAALRTALDHLDYRPIVALTGPVHVAAVDVVHARLVMAVDDPAHANAVGAGASAGVPVLFVSGASAVDAASRNADPNVPPYRGGHGIVFSSAPSGGTFPEGCTLGFAARNRSGTDGALTAGHCYDTHRTPYVFHNDTHPVYIGNAAGAYYSNGGAVDYYAYSAVAGKTTSPTVFTNWPSTIKVYATDAGHERVGYTRIKSGRTTGYGSGVLAYTDVDIDGSGSQYSGGWRLASYSTDFGDSGMPVWHPLNGYAWASGINHGYVILNGTRYGDYCAIGYVLSASGFTLKTTT